MTKHLLLFLFLGCSLTALAFSDLPYKVKYVGVEDATALKTIKLISQLSTLKKKPPDSLAALKYRAESDIPAILKVLHSYGYYEASIQIQVKELHSGALVLVKVYPGPAYLIDSFTISLFQNTKDRCITCPQLKSGELGLSIGSRVKAADVINAELKALQKLSQCGYPLAFISNRSMIVDGDSKGIKIHLEIDTGPLSYFGPVSIQGNKSIKPLFFNQRLGWKEGEIYSSESIEEGQRTLMDTGLFSSILIVHDDKPNAEGQLPLRIEASESKHRSVYGGVSYQTYYGPGLTFGWEHRNVGGLGRTISLQGDLTRRSHSGLATYQLPNFLAIGQDYVWEAQAMHLSILPYKERSYHLTNRLEKKFSKKMRVSFGLEGERLFVTSSVQNGEYWILETPLFLALNLSNDLLDPTTGFNFEYKAIPTFALSPGHLTFITQKFVLSHYLPVDSKHAITFAQKLSGGFILSGAESSVPVPKRFFGGSEEELRGYAYYSVSPLSKKGLPEGGRSAIYYTFETRLRISKLLGLVPFFDMGNVSEEIIISPNGKWLKSAGLGLRYFSFIGPFRLDIGFPLNPREGIDKKYRILISVGQTF